MSTSSPSSPRLVWYASYGSNMRRARFMTYIEGGTPEGGHVEHPGCSDKTEPRKAVGHRAPHTIYFGQHSNWWTHADGSLGGVAFVTPEATHHPDPARHAILRMYLVTQEQFEQVMHQENDFLQEVAVRACVDTILDQGTNKLILDRESWYATLLHLGEYEGYPIFTFTSHRDWSREAEVLNHPGPNYIYTIACGIREALPQLSEDEIVEYFASRPGIYGKMTKQDIANQITRD